MRSDIIGTVKGVLQNGRDAPQAIVSGGVPVVVVV